MDMTLGGDEGRRDRSRARRLTSLLVVLLAALSVLAVAGAASALARTAYVANSGSNDVTPIDTADNTAGSPIPVGSIPGGVAITPDGATAYVVDNNGGGAHGDVTPIDTATNTAGSTIPVGGFPYAIAITPDGGTAYTTNGGDDTVTPIDTATNTAGSPITVGAFPVAIAITPDGGTAYVANGNDGTVTPIDTATNTAGTPITVGSFPEAIAITPDGATAYVANEGDGTVTPIETATNTAGTAITAGAFPIAIAITPDGGTAYLANSGDGTVTPINTATNAAGTPIAVGSTPDAIAITPDGATAYVVNNASNNVTPIHTASNTAGSAIAVGNTPDGIAITPDQAPTAAFNSDTATIGQATSFDASASSDPDGTVATYHWDYGDGDTADTGSATINHAYSAPGTYMATLRITDDEGCSTAQIFTGQTMSCNGSSVAQITHQVTVSKASPTIATSATDATLGGAIYDVASLGSGHNPGGSITFHAYGPGDATCSGTAAFNSGPVTVSGNNDLVSAHFTPTAAGTYRWTADYSGDSNNQTDSSACNAAKETSTVAKATPTIATNASAGVALGGSIHDTATLTSGYNPAGTITFKLYGPNDASCSLPHIFSQTRPVSGNGSYSSVNFIPARAGTYRWTASYSGGANNEAAAGACNAAHESVTVTKASPTLTTRASVVNGNRVGDRATLAHGAGPTGQLTFRLYRPGDTNCSMTPLFQRNVHVSGNGSYDSARFTASKGGTYRFRASYAGDAKNKPATGACNAPGESATVPGG
jgi:YVTN family beta-propeller protein